MLLSNPQEVTIRKLNNSFITIIKDGKEYCSGVITKQKSKKGNPNKYFRVGSNLFRVDFVVNTAGTFVSKIFLLTKKNYTRKILKPKNKYKTTIRYVKTFETEVEFYISKAKTNEVKKQIRNKKKRKFLVEVVYAKMKALYNNNHKVLVINKSGKYFELDLIDAFFVGTQFNLELNKKKYRADYFVIEMKTLIDSLLNDYQRFVDFIFVLELFEQTPRYFSGSILFSVLKKIKNRLKEFHRKKRGK